MIKTTFKIYQPPGQDVFLNAQELRRRIFEETKPLAKRMSDAYANSLRTTLVRVRAIATGKTLHSVKEEAVLESGASRGLVLRRVTVRQAIVYINFGRKPGKAPIRFVGTRTGKRGKPVKVFEPVAGLIEWFNALSIRKELWMPIARAIGRRGIKPREVVIRSANASRKAWQNALEDFGVRVATRLFRK